MRFVVMMIHLVAIMWFGVVSHDHARDTNRRLRERALRTGDFEMWGAWQDRERVAIFVRCGVAVTLLAALAILSLTGVYQ